EAIRIHKEHMRMVFESLVREGVEAAEFEPVDPRETSRLLFISLVHFCHPVLVAEYLQDQGDLEGDARSAVRFLLRAITPRGWAMSTARPPHPQAYPRCDDRTISSVTTFSRPEKRAMPQATLLPRPPPALAALAALLVLAGCEANTAPAPKS